MKILMITLSFLLIFIGCTDHSNHSGKASQTTNSEKKKYICPMHPQITSDKPGQQCSICGMDMVLAEDEEEHKGHDHNEHKGATNRNGSETSDQVMKMPKDRVGVSLSLDKQQVIGVKTEKVQKIDIFETIKAPGRIAFDPDLYTAQSEYLEAIRQQRKVKNSPLKEIRRSTNEMVRSAKTRLQVLGLGEEQIKAIASKGSVSEGLIVSGNNDNLIYADVFESNLSNVKPGQKVQIKASFIADKPLMGEVVSVDQLIDPKTRTGKVRIKINKNDLSIRPEAFVTVAISVPLGKHIAVPLEAILDTGEDLFVFVKKDEGRFEPRKITKIFETDKYIAVIKGLKEGEVVVTSANFMMDSESRLKSVIRSAGSSTGHNH
jgi:Cu(I)/Ag(I) efflux system membrane fusion protein